MMSALRILEVAILLEVVFLEFMVEDEVNQEAAADPYQERSDKNRTMTEDYYLEKTVLVVRRLKSMVGPGATYKIEMFGKHGRDQRTTSIPLQEF